MHKAPNQSANMLTQQSQNSNVVKTIRRKVTEEQRAAAKQGIFDFLKIIGRPDANELYIGIIPLKNAPYDFYLDKERGLGYWDATVVRKRSYQAVLNLKTNILSFLRNDGQASKIAEDGIGRLIILNQRGNGIYALPGKGHGFSDADIESVSCLYYECDDISLEEQSQKMDAFAKATGVTPGALETSKSIHVYLRLRKPLPTDEFQCWQKRLIAHMDSDGNIHNSSRKMRLPGFNHVSWDAENDCMKEKMVSVIQMPSKYASLNKLDELLPEVSYDYSAARKEVIAADMTRLLAIQKGGKKALKAEIERLISAWNALAPYKPGEGRYLSLQRSGLGTHHHIHSLVANENEADTIVRHILSSWTGNTSSDFSGKSLYEMVKEVASNPANSKHGEATIQSLLGQASWESKGQWKDPMAVDIEIGKFVNKLLAPLREKPEAIVREAVENISDRMKELQLNDVDICSLFDPDEDEDDEEEDLYEYVRNLTALGRDLSSYEMFSEGDRLKIIKLWAKDADAPHILYLASGTGGGKSHSMADIRFEDFGPECKGVMVVSNDPRKYTVAKMGKYTQVYGRNDGVVHRGQYNPGGAALIRNANEEDRKNPENILERFWCEYKRIHDQLTAIGIKSKDACAVCPAFETCGGTPGWFRHDRAEALKKKYILIHPYSLPSPLEFDYSGWAIVIDEAQDTVMGHTDARFERDFILSMAALLSTADDDEFLDGIELQTTISHLANLLIQVEGERFGYNWDRVKQGFPVLSDDSLEQAKAWQKKWKEIIFSKTRLTSKVFEEGSVDSIHDRRKQMIQLAELLMTPGMSVSVERDAVIVTTKGSHLNDCLKSSMKIVIADATATTKSLDLKLGTVGEIKAIAQEGTLNAKPENLKVIQVVGLGKGTSQRREWTKPVYDALKKELKPEAFIDLHAHLDDPEKEYCWYRDNRGTNEMEKCNSLMLIGSPYANIGALSREFYGIGADADSSFGAFAEQRRLQEVAQAFGRVRANRRPDELITVYVVSDSPLPSEWVDEKIHYEDVVPDLADNRQSKLQRLISGLNLGANQTQEQLAELASTTQSNVSKMVKAVLGDGGMGLLKSLRKIFQTLYSSISTWNISEESNGRQATSTETSSSARPKHGLQDAFNHLVERDGLAELLWWVEDRPATAQYLLENATDEVKISLLMSMMRC